MKSQPKAKRKTNFLKRKEKACFDKGCAAKKEDENALSCRLRYEILKKGVKTKK